MSTREHTPPGAEHAGEQPHAEHFQDLARQQHAAHFGMWLFLSSETLLFAGLFGVFAGYRMMYTADFLAASHHNSVAIGTANTAILITSSFAVALALHAVRLGAHRVGALCVGVTVALGGVFLVLKGIEYADHFRHGIYPGSHYAFAELPSHGANLFFTLYYFLTGLHALHVLGGMTFLALLIHPIARRRYGEANHLLLENGALYWHLVDIIWIFLWPLLYLVG